MTKKAHDKSNDFGWVIIEVERLCEDGFLILFKFMIPSFTFGKLDFLGVVAKWQS